MRLAVVSLVSVTLAVVLLLTWAAVAFAQTSYDGQYGDPTASGETAILSSGDSSSSGGGDSSGHSSSSGGAALTALDPANGTNGSAAGIYDPSTGAGGFTSGVIPLTGLLPTWGPR